MRAKANFCYVTGSNRPDEPQMMARMIQSARDAGVPEDFHAYATSDVAGAITHTRKFEFNRYMFKVDLLTRMAQSDYDYLVWIDPDNYFVRDPGDLKELIRENLIWVSMEGDIASRNAQWGWWGVPNPSMLKIYEECGVFADQKWNTNAGFFIVRTSAVAEFAEKMYEIRRKFELLGFHEVTEEPPLAIAGQTMVSTYHLNTFDNHKCIWVSDWIKAWGNAGRLPDGTPFPYKDWVSQTDLGTVNSAIVHLMGGKHLMQTTNPSTQRPLNLMQRVRSVVGVVGSTVANGGQLLSQEAINARQAICAACPNYTGSGCQLCGCQATRDAVWSNKLAHAAAECPMQPPRWSALRRESSGEKVESRKT